MHMMNEAMSSSLIVINKDAVINEETKLLSPTSNLLTDSDIANVDEVYREEYDRDPIDDWEVLMLARIKCGPWQIELNMNTRVWIIDRPLVLDRINDNYYKEIRGAETKRQHVNESRVLSPPGSDGDAQVETQCRVDDDLKPGTYENLEKELRGPTQGHKQNHVYKHPKFVIETDDKLIGNSAYIIDVDKNTNPEDVAKLKDALISYVTYIETRSIADSRYSEDARKRDNMLPDIQTETSNKVPFIEDVMPYDIAMRVADALDGKRRASKSRMGESVANHITLGADYLSTALVKVLRDSIEDFVFI